MGSSSSQRPKLPPLRETYAANLFAALDRDGRPGSMFDAVRRVLELCGERGCNLRRRDQQRAQQLLERVETLAGDLASFGRHLRDGRDIESEVR